MERLELGSAAPAVNPVVEAFASAQYLRAEALAQSSDARLSDAIAPVHFFVGIQLLRPACASALLLLWNLLVGLARPQRALLLL